jgi:sortase A
MSVIDKGVAHWAGTSTVGGSGNVVLAGHRTTKTRPFHNIDKLDNGDLIFMTNGSGLDVMYRVSDTYIVDPNDLWITYDDPKPTLTMFACHPKGSARFRIVVKAEMVSDRWIG